jgi:hypothetical protein
MFRLLTFHKFLKQNRCFTLTVDSDVRNSEVFVFYRSRVITNIESPSHVYTPPIFLDIRAMGNERIFDQNATFEAGTAFTG